MGVNFEMILRELMDGRAPKILAVPRLEESGWSVITTYHTIIYDGDKPLEVFECRRSRINVLFCVN